LQELYSPFASAFASPEHAANDSSVDGRLECAALTIRRVLAMEDSR
jgi:hypothetical protein